MLPVELARVPTRMIFERHPTIDYEILLIIQRWHGGEYWICAKHRELAQAVGKSLSSVRRSLRRLISGRYVAVRYHVVIDGRPCAVAYRALFYSESEG